LRREGDCWDLCTSSRPINWERFCLTADSRFPNKVILLAR
jgi:hypothetical protein